MPGTASSAADLAVPPDTDWCTFEYYSENYCDQIYSQEERLANWNILVRDKALDTLYETEKYMARNRRNTVFMQRDLYTDMTASQ